MLKSVTQFLKAQFTQNKLDGLLKLMELEHIKKCTQLKPKREHCKKICMCKDDHRKYCAKHKLMSCNG
jgi:hypothetical protein